VLAAVLAAAACGGAERPLPRLERYDFLGQTRADLARLRQIAPADDDGGAQARYALARAHVDWLVLGLVQEQADDALLRALAVDLGVDGASMDDRLSLDQVHAILDAVSAEVRRASATGGEARRWAGEAERLLAGVRAGWEQLGPELFAAVASASEAADTVGPAADLLAVGWTRVALRAATDRPASERAAFLVRMAGYAVPDVVEALAQEGGTLGASPLAVGCDAVEGRGRGESSAAYLERVRRGCSGAIHGFAAQDGEALSAELVGLSVVVRDVVARRRRLVGRGSDPLVAAAAEVLAGFDAELAALRIPLPLPVPGPRLPSPIAVPGPGVWRPGDALVVVPREGPAEVWSWPAFAAVEGAPALEWRRGGAGAGQPLAERLHPMLGGAGDAAIVSLVVEDGVTVERALAVADECRSAGARYVDLIVRFGDVGLAALPVVLSRGAGGARSSADRRALIVVGESGVHVGTADGGWNELQDEGGAPAFARLLAALAGHVAGRGNPAAVLSARPGVQAARLAAVLDALTRAPRSQRDDATAGWDVQVDPEEPSAPLPVADTVSGAVDLHRVRLRQCYERYLRGGGRRSGGVVLALAVGADGRVSSARVVETELGAQPALDTCLVGEAQRIRFPADAAGSTVRVPLRFVPR
jgi:hypothetical protein